MITNIYAIDSFVLAFFSFSIITLLIRSTLHAVNEKKKKKGTRHRGGKTYPNIPTLSFPRSTFNIYLNFNTKLIRIPETRGGNITEYKTNSRKTLCNVHNFLP